ncbi:tannase and feruloyl esterase [Delitschia confertaspora ATCC 74209]|uniref:Carboxylic ester hydrolase n=1 Tax=Delitschia confertaspora ATCC 74209 TaxID=1513339 RepID=A0A9P4JLV5_9PLEO|nr:tannase and feruloyl esterase [Delitschia confertaspora ATCC 74209]
MFPPLFFLAPLAWFPLASTSNTIFSSKTCNTTFTYPHIPGAEILSITSHLRTNATIPPSNGFPPSTGLNFCNVTITLTHPGTSDHVAVSVWLPLASEWNGRFQATGGSGFANGIFESQLAAALQAGYAAASTDGGTPSGGLAGYGDLSWVLKDDRSINWDLLQNFSGRSSRDMVLVGKAITGQFYGEKVRYSYWNGCSEGGREGYAMAQRWPGLVDGVMANAPVVSQASVAMGGFWGRVVMKDLGVEVGECEMEWFGERVMEACDGVDGVEDGVITDPEECRFDPYRLIGKKVQCDGKEVEITVQMAEGVQKILEGPQTPYGAPIWVGLAPGTDLTGRSGAVLLSELGLKYLVLKDVEFDVSAINYSSYTALWAQANREFDWLLGTDNPDLSAFQDAGGKLLTWHGLTDAIVPAANTIQYRKKVEMVMGGSQAVNNFYRLFLAPGVAHCGRGAGPQPLDPLEALVAWVEKGEAPETLDAANLDEKGELMTRDLCLYPRKMKYMGIGDPKRASSWSCDGEENEEEEEEESLEEAINSPRDFLEGLQKRFIRLGLV